VAGLLHDVGKLVLFHLVTQDYLKVLGVARAEDVAIRVAEQRILGFTHDHVGGLLAERWRLPVRLSEAVAYHHRPDLAQTAKREASIVHAADVFTRALGLGSGGDDAVPALEPESWRRLGLPGDALEALMGELEEQYVEARGILLNSSEHSPRRIERVAHAS
jgi:HD-like signal output (HDOD) protein